MKKLLTILILCLVCVLCAVGFAACGGDNSEPEQGQSAQSDYLTKAQLSAGYKLVAKAAWAKLGFENVLEEETATTTFSAYSAALPETGVKLTEGTFNWAALRGNAGASVALINMIGDYYKNENFVITDKVVSFEIEDVFYSPSGEQVRTPSTLFIRPKIDVANKRVEIELRMKNEQYDNYYYFDLGFDFETETLNYFVFGLHVMGTYSMQKMDTNGDFYFANDGGADGEEMLPSAEFIAAVDRLEADFKTAIADGLTLTGNFQSEYDNFGTVSSKIFFDSVNSVNDNGNGQGQGGEDKTVLTAETDFSALVSEELTKIEWQKAFSEYSFDNCTIKHENEHYNNRADFRYAEVRDGNQCVMFELYENSAFNGQSYHTVVGNEYSEYTKEEENAEFIKFVLPVNEYEDHIAWQMSYTFIMPTFADFYNDFMYSDTDNAYVYHGDEGLESNSPMEGWNMSYKNIVIKFINGKVACISAESLHGDDGVYKWFVFDYGTTNVVLPTEYIDASDLEPDEPNPSEDENVLTADEFLDWLAETETASYSDQSKHYATVTGSYATQGGGKPDQNYSGTYSLFYELDKEEYGHAYALIFLEDDGQVGLDVLGFSGAIEKTITLAQDGTFKIKKVSENFDITAEFENHGITMTAHFIIDKDGYVLYRLEQMGDQFTMEFIATEYNKA
ncbi:MAG: hypothetical protein IJQ87_05095 [Clostridia bacterium]|nr:hypothetical protein [Clostridia bacterium]